MYKWVHMKQELKALGIIRNLYENNNYYLVYVLVELHLDNLVNQSIIPHSRPTHMPASPRYHSQGQLFVKYPCLFFHN